MGSQSSDTDIEKRHFARIVMDGEVELECSGNRWKSSLLDISLKGALVSRPEGYRLEVGEHCTITIFLAQCDITITMQATMSHSEETRLGFRCDHIDLDSISHLRRIVELNVGNENELERELSDLIRFHTA